MELAIKITIGILILIFVLGMIRWRFIHKRNVRRLKESFNKSESKASYRPEPVPKCAVKDCEQRSGGACTGEECWKHEPIKDE